MKNFKNVFLLAVMAISVVFVSCDKEEGDEIKDGSFSGDIQVIASTDVVVDTVKAVVWDDNEETNSVSSFVVTSVAYKNDGFTLDLAPVPAQYLKQLWNTSVPKGLKVSDVKTKGVSINNFKAYTGLEYVGKFEYGLNIDDNTRIRTLFIYVDRDLTVTGSYTLNDEYETYTEKNNVSLKKGWNKMYAKFSQSNTYNTSTSEVTTAEPKGLKWYFTSYSDDYRSSTQTRAAKSVAKQWAFSLFN